MSPSKELDTWKSGRYLGWKCHWVDEEGRFPFSTNNPTTLSQRKDDVFEVKCVTVSCYWARAFKQALYATTALLCCFANRSVAKVSFKVFLHLKGHSHAILVHFKNKKYMSSHKWTPPTNNGLVLLPKTILLHWNCFLSSIAMDGTDGNGLQFEKIRLNFSNSFSVLTLNWY